MKKLLHERLRGIAEERDFMGVHFSADSLRNMADEIEHHYVPRPRFEDDEPVQGGDKFDRGHAHFVVIDLHHPECYWLLEDYDGCLTDVPIERPRPKVLDAYGVEIKEGDKVYDLLNMYDCPLQVISVKKTLITVTIPDGKGYTSFAPGNLSHKEPDTLEKLCNDMKHNREASLFNFANRFLAIMERGT